MRLFRSINRYFRDAFKSVIRNFSLSLASISCITITLIVVAISIVLSYNVEKIYLAKINGILDKDSIDKLKKGIVIDNKKVDFEFKVRKKNTKKNNSMIEIRIKEGRNHIVKNIFLSIGYKVEKLTRTSYGNLTVGNLNPGEYRELTVKEIKRFYQ